VAVVKVVEKDRRWVEFVLIALGRVMMLLRIVIAFKELSLLASLLPVRDLGRSVFNFAQALDNVSF
jgi:hypothetical protein